MEWDNKEMYCLPVRGGGVCIAGVSFLLGFFCSCSAFWEGWIVLPFLGFFLRSQLLISCSERSSARQKKREKMSRKWSRGEIIKQMVKRKALIIQLSSRKTEMTVEKELLNMKSVQEASVPYYVGAEWLWWSCFVGGRHKAGGEAVGSGVLHGWGKLHHHAEGHRCPAQL